MNYKVTVAPTSEPLTTAEAKTHLVIESSVTDHDTYVDRLIKAARQHCEEYLGIGLLTQTVQQYWDDFPACNPDYNKWGGLELSHGNIQSVSFLKYLDTDGVEQQLTQATKATGTLTFTGVPSDTQTVTINSTVYTFQTTLTDTANNVLIGASATECARNLTNAINLSEGAGLWYAASTAINSDVRATYSAGVVTITAKLATIAPNSYATTETCDNASWGAATMSGGDSDGVDYKADLTSYMPKIVPAYNTSWPAVRNEVNAVWCEYIRGWTAAANVPEPIRQAMLLMIAKWFECREDSVFRMPTASQYLLDMYKQYAL